MEHSSRPLLMTRPNRVGRLSKTERSAARWIYLGKDARQRRGVESLLNPARRLEEGERFRRIADSYRQPFLDFVAQVGTLQPEPVLWWSTSFSWKMWESCDLFLLVVYLAMAAELAREPSASADPLILVVEDPWLYRQMREGLTQPRLRFIGRGSLVGWKIHALTLGAARRLAWLLRTLRDLRRQRRATPGGSPRLPERPAVALYSFPLQRSLAGETGWRDPYLPGLEELLKGLGYEVVRFSPPDQRGFEQDLGRRHRNFQPLILHATAEGLWRSFTTFWWPRWPRRLSVLQGLPIRRLIQRECWLELSRSSLSSNRMFYECLRRMLQGASWRWVVFPYENQPWEKLAVLAARERGIRSAGVQMAVFSRYFLPYALGSGEEKIHPLPDVIFTAGPPWRMLHEEGGIPLSRLLLAGNIRHRHLTGSGPPPARNGSGQDPSSEIFVVLPIDPCLAGQMLAALASAFPDGGISEGLHFRIRPHPMRPMDPAEFGFPVKATPTPDPSDIQEALRDCGLVLFAGSLAGLEALAAGRKVLRYRSSSLLDVDEYYGVRVPVCSDQTLRRAVLEQIAAGPSASPPDGAQPLLTQLFSPFNAESMEQLFALPEESNAVK